MRRQRIGHALTACLLVTGWMVSAVPAAGPAEEDSGTWLSAIRTAAEEVGATIPGAVVPEAPRKRCPVDLSVDYTLVTDYIWRGINNSEYRGEGREKLNHQLGVGMSFETPKCGTVGALVWLEWYADQERLTTNSNDHLQEVDYIAYWSYRIEPIATTFEAGWICYHYPTLSGDEGHTNEWYVTLRFDDAKLFGTRNGVLNPYFALYMDVDDFKRGCWLELGASHDFTLADLECCGKMPVVKDLTITPSVVLGYDHRYLDKFFSTGRGSSRAANLQYGLDITYDLTSALRLPERLGRFSVTGFLKFRHAFRDDLLDDEFWGGATFAWKW